MPTSLLSIVSVLAAWFFCGLYRLELVSQLILIGWSTLCRIVSFDTSYAFTSFQSTVEMCLCLLLKSPNYFLLSYLIVPQFQLTSIQHMLQLTGRSHLTRSYLSASASLLTSLHFQLHWTTPNSWVVLLTRLLFWPNSNLSFNCSLNSCQLVSPWSE
jgi:hypothetical protein